MSKRLSKCIAFFDYFDKSLIVLYVTTGSISIASFAIFSLAFSFSTRIVRTLFKTTEIRRKSTIKLSC